MKTLSRLFLIFSVSFLTDLFILIQPQPADKLHAFKVVGYATSWGGNVMRSSIVSLHY